MQKKKKKKKRPMSPAGFADYPIIQQYHHAHVTSNNTTLLRRRHPQFHVACRLLQMHCAAMKWRAEEMIPRYDMISAWRHDKVRAKVKNRRQGEDIRERATVHVCVCSMCAVCVCVQRRAACGKS